MHAYIITGADDGARHQKIDTLLDEWRVSVFDRIANRDPQSSVGIDEIRMLQTRISLKPVYSPVSALIIWHAELLTTEAQNALLKTLEEPPPHVRIILESATADLFLPTVLSRCQLVNLGSTALCPDEQLLRLSNIIGAIASSSVGKKLQLLDTVAKNKDEAAIWIDLAISAMRQQLLSADETPSRRNAETPNLQTYEVASFLRLLLNARTQLSSNVSYKLVLDNAFLSLEHI